MALVHLLSPWVHVVRHPFLAFQSAVDNVEDRGREREKEREREREREREKNHKKYKEVYEPMVVWY